MCYVGTARLQGAPHNMRSSRSGFWTKTFLKNKDFQQKTYFQSL